MFENVYLVTDKLQIFSMAEVEAAETHLGTRLPTGYREYVSTLGEGEYCGFVQIYGPQHLANNHVSYRSSLVKLVDCWEDGFDVLGRERIPECIVIGATIDADLIVFHPEAPDALYELPRHDSGIYRLGASLEEALAWYCQERLKIALSYFESRVGRTRGVPHDLKIPLDELKDWLVQFGRYNHLETKLNENPGVSLATYRLLKGQLDQVAPELSEVTAFYKSFGGYVLAYKDGFDRVSAGLVHDTGLNTDTMQTISEYLRSKAV